MTKNYGWEHQKLYAYNVWFVSCGRQYFIIHDAWYGWELSEVEHMLSLVHTEWVNLEAGTLNLNERHACMCDYFL